MAQDKRKRRRHSPLANDALQSLRHAFLDAQLAAELARGHSWAALDSHGVPFGSPLEVDALTARHVLSCELAVPSLERGDGTDLTAMHVQAGRGAGSGARGLAGLCCAGRAERGVGADAGMPHRHSHATWAYCSHAAHVWWRINPQTASAASNGRLARHAGS